jgi:catechol 2,3-dioxygenase-like lactoylglutathione lyase family enzyme
MTERAEEKGINLPLLSIVIPTLHFEQTISFYRDILGLAVNKKGDHGALIVAGNVNILIYPTEPDSEFAPTGHSMYFSLIIPDVERRLEERLLEAEVTIPKTSANGPVTVMLDPNGNLVELIKVGPSEYKPLQLKLKMLSSCVADMYFGMTPFFKNLGVAEVPEEVVHQIRSLQAKLRAVLDQVRQQASTRPDSEEQAQVAHYQELRTEMITLGEELCRLVNAIAQAADAAHAAELQKFVGYFRKVVENTLTLPD